MWTVSVFMMDIENVKDSTVATIEMNYDDLMLILGCGDQSKTFSHSDLFEEDAKSFKSNLDLGHYAKYFIAEYHLNMISKEAEIRIKYS